MAEPLGTKNQRIKRLRRLVTRRRARSEERAFVVEGPVLAAEVLASDLTVSELYLEVGTQQDLAAQARSLGVQVFEAVPGALEGALDTSSPRPVAAIVEFPTALVDGPEGDGWGDALGDQPILVLADLNDPGNAGTLIRTAEAAGFGAVVLAGDSVDPSNPKVVRAAAGALFRLPVYSVSWDEMLTRSAHDSRQVQATVVAAEGHGRPVADIDQVDLTASVIVLGNEAHGLAPEQVADADQLITIPLAGPTESLNVAAAGAVVCFASWQQRRQLPSDGSTPHSKLVGQIQPQPSGSD